MMRSMTGFGTATVETPTARIVVEIRGVNQRHLDVRVTGAREFVAWEREVRDRVRAVVGRGRVEVSLQRHVAPAQRRLRVTVHEDAVDAYLRGARRVAKRHGLAGQLTVGDVLGFPEVCEVREEPPNARREVAALRRALALALGDFDAERRREGRDLVRDMQGRARTLGTVTRRLARAVPGMQRALRARLIERVERLAAGVDLEPARVAYEVAALVERGDVSEELVRLESHVAALRVTLRADGPVGKRIEFLVQEIQRELNTTGAKLTDPRLTAEVLRGKEAVEKLREQVQNVE